jgi:hypothetical protein
VVPVAIGAVALTLASMTGASAWSERGAILPDLETTYVCGNALWAAYNTVTYNGRSVRQVLQDDGKVDLQVLAVNGRYGRDSGGMWVTVHNSHGSDNGGEGRKRVPVADITAQGVVFTKARIIRTDNHVSSVELTVLQECPA